MWEKLELDLERVRVVTLVGGGGKSSTMYALARAARDRGKTVIVTTSTHILPHPGIFLTDNPQPDHLRTCLAAHGVITLGTLGRADKLCGTGEIGVCKAVADVVLIEGDGARIKPLKVPADHEPVIPPESDGVVAVAGLDALGQPIGEICHRPERVAAFLGKSLEEEVTEADMAAILASPQGGRKCVGAGMAFRCLLNKADTPALERRGQIVAGLLAQKGIQAYLNHYTQEERGGTCWF